MYIDSIYSELWWLTKLGFWSERVRKSVSQTVYDVILENPIKHVGDVSNKSKR